MVVQKITHVVNRSSWAPTQMDGISISGTSLSDDLCIAMFPFIVVQSTVSIIVHIYESHQQLMKSELCIQFQSVTAHCHLHINCCELCSDDKYD